MSTSSRGLAQAATTESNDAPARLREERPFGDGKEGEYMIETK